MLVRISVCLGMLLLSAVACATSIVGGADGTRVQTGVWGGEHLALTVTESGAHLEFDCASGDVTEPLTVDRDGRLGVDGVYVRGHGGPIRSGEEPERKPARYSGRIEGNTMTLDVTLTDSKESVGTFTLTHGAQPRLRRCL
jgi:hypothetical protein